MPKAVKGTKRSYLYGWVYVTALVPTLLYYCIIVVWSSCDQQLHHCSTITTCAYWDSGGLDSMYMYI